MHRNVVSSTFTDSPGLPRLIPEIDATPAAISCRRLTGWNRLCPPSHNCISHTSALSPSTATVTPGPGGFSLTRVTSAPPGVKCGVTEADQFAAWHFDASFDLAELSLAVINTPCQARESQAGCETPSSKFFSETGWAAGPHEPPSLSVRTAGNHHL